MPGEMMMALRKKRLEGMGKVAEPVEAVAEPKDEMAEYWERLEAMDAKIDQILGLLQPEAGPEAEPEVSEEV